MSFYNDPSAFEKAVFGAFGIVWANLTQIDAPNVYFDPNNKSAYVKIRILGDPGPTPRYGGSTNIKIFNRRGLFQAQCFVPKDTGTVFVYSMVERALKFMESVKPVDSVVFSEITAPEEVGIDGPWFQVAVSAQWSYFSQRPD